MALLLKLSAVARALGVSAATVEDLRARGQIRTIDVAGDVMVERDEIERWLAEKRAEGERRAIAEALADPSSWVRLARESPEWLAEIVASEFEPGTFGAWLQAGIADEASAPRANGALRPAPASPRLTPTDEQFADIPLPEWFVRWNQVVTEDDVRALEQAIAAAKDERPLQKLFEERPHLLAQHLGGGHGRWVIPQKRLGSEFVPDFLIGDRSSIGFQWHLVELESPRARMFTRDGVESAQLKKAQAQISDWRTWIADNLDYSRRPREAHGLGLPEISPAGPALILIGDDDRGEPPGRRRLHLQQTGVAIHTYRYILDRARQAAAR